MSRAALLLTAAATAGLTGLVATVPAAGAATVTAMNACTSKDAGVSGYGTLPLKLTPASVAQNGRQLDVGAVTPSVEIPSWLPDKMNTFNAGLLLLGQSASVPVTAWMAVTPTGSTDGTRVITTTGTIGVNVQNFSVKSVTMNLKPSASTSWHASDAGGTLSVSQAGPGALAAVPEIAGANPKGSLFIRGSVAGMTIQVDCQPGTNSNPSDPSSLTPDMIAGAPAVIASADFAAVTTPAPTQAPTPAPAPTSIAAPAPAAAQPTAQPTVTTASKPTAPQSAGVLAIASPTITFGSAAVLVNVSCPAGAAPCGGTATITSAKKLKVGKGAKKVRALASGRYSVPAGTTAPIKLKLSADGVKLRKKALVAVVALTPTTGSGVSKTLRAN